MVIKEKFSTNRTVGPSHLNRKGELAIRSLVDFMQDCSIFQLDSEKELDYYFKANNAGMFLSHRQIKLIRLPLHGEELTIKTWVYQCHQSYGCRNTNVYDEKGEICVASSAIGMFVHYDAGTLMRVPQTIIDTIPIFEPYNMEYLPRKISIPKNIKAKEIEPFYVWRFLIDANNHVNNARYISLAQEFIPEDFEIRSIRVEYILPAKQGEMIYPKIIELENGYIVDLQSSEGKHFSVVEFTR